MIATCRGVASFPLLGLGAQFPAPLKNAHPAQADGAPQKNAHPPAHRALPDGASSAGGGQHQGVRGTARPATTAGKPTAHRKRQDLKGRGELRAPPERAESKQRTARGNHPGVRGTARPAPTGRKEQRHSKWHPPRPPPGGRSVPHGANPPRRG
ncbi:exported hypothetical protein [Actinacidiphila bryophytorum]|uniref:Uncharacterized protein n=1 Tax=Actinacidiphila bryophytorum TaxID=1436133 RepID=A0A9W4MG79_9ACTN|nr:exported hypothetical protein [Actinacidiphila bryophytorum]